MDTTHWWVLGTGIAALLALPGLGFAAMSTNPPHKVSDWVPKVFFALSIAVLSGEGFYFWNMFLFARIIAIIGIIGLLMYLFFPLLKRKFIKRESSAVSTPSSQTGQLKATIDDLLNDMDRFALKTEQGRPKKPKSKDSSSLEQWTAKNKKYEEGRALKFSAKFRSNIIDLGIKLQQQQHMDDKEYGSLDFWSVPNHSQMMFIQNQLKQMRSRLIDTINAQNKESKPFQLSNRKELISAVHQVKETAGDVILTSSALGHLRKVGQEPPQQFVANFSNAFEKYREALKKLECEALIAGEAFHNPINSFFARINSCIQNPAPPIKQPNSTIVMLNNEENTNKLNDAMNGVVKEIDEISQSASHKGGSQI